MVSNGSNRELAARLEDNARQYGKLLVDLGFDALTIGPQSRPILDQSIRKSAADVPAGAAVAVLVTGLVLARDDDLFILPSDVSAEVANGQATIDAETIRLSFVFRRLAAAAPKEIVAVLDDCSATAELFDHGTQLAGVPVSVLCLKKTGSPPGTDPVERVMSAMKEEGLTFEQFANKLRSSARDGSLDVFTSRALSTSFHFFDPHRFDRLDSPCNRIAVGASAARARTASLAGPIEACSTAMRRWPYVPSFRAKRDAGLEQRVFQNSVKLCEVAKSRDGYKSNYPSGRYIREATAFLEACRPPRPETSSRPSYHPPPPPPPPHPSHCFLFNGVRRCE
ncbi:hypothetical protein [Methylobacterium sp. SI9]|uniref:hypothetical protein n=1 Tax=Methylobacterium guangdongense TaxID=3138811 RepID=UPI00313D7619